MVPVWAGQGLHQPPSPLSSPAREHEGFRAGQWSSEGTDQHQKCHLFQELFLFQTHNSGYYTGPQDILPTQPKTNSMGTETNSRSTLKPKLLPREEFVRLHLRQGISITLDFFLSSLASTWHTQTRAQALSYQNKSRHSVLNINSQIAEARGLWLQTNLPGTSSHEGKANTASAVKSHTPPVPQTKSQLILPQ